MPRDKSCYRDKRSSSYSSESSYDRKKSKTKHKRRSRSRDKSETSRNSRRRRSASRTKYKRRSYSRSVSKDRYESKLRRRSSSRSKSKRSKHSRDRSRSLSSSRSRSKYSKSSKKHRRKSRSSSRSDSFDIGKDDLNERSYKSKSFINVDNTDCQVEKAIKAAEAAGVSLTKIPTYEYKDVEIREDMPTITDRNVLDDINSESFVQKSFTSSKNNRKTHNIVIDLNAETVKVPESEAKPENDDSIINFANIPSEAELKEMWIRKLYQFRKKMLKGEIQ